MFTIKNQSVIKLFCFFSFYFLIFSTFYSFASFYSEKKALCIVFAIIYLILGIFYNFQMKKINNEEEIKKQRLIIEMTHPRYS